MLLVPSRLFVSTLLRPNLLRLAPLTPQIRSWPSDRHKYPSISARVMDGGREHNHSFASPTFLAFWRCTCRRSFDTAKNVSNLKTLSCSGYTHGYHTWPMFHTVDPLRCRCEVREGKGFEIVPQLCHRSCISGHRFGEDGLGYTDSDDINTICRTIWARIF